MMDLVTELPTDIPSKRQSRLGEREGARRGAARPPSPPLSLSLSLCLSLSLSLFVCVCVCMCMCVCVCVCNINGKAGLANEKARGGEQRAAAAETLADSLKEQVAHTLTRGLHTLSLWHLLSRSLSLYIDMSLSSTMYAICERERFVKRRRGACAPCLLLCSRCRS